MEIVEEENDKTLEEIRKNLLSTHLFIHSFLESNLFEEEDDDSQE